MWLPTPPPPGSFAAASAERSVLRYAPLGSVDGDGLLGRAGVVAEVATTADGWRPRPRARPAPRRRWRA